MCVCVCVLRERLIHPMSIIGILFFMRRKEKTEQCRAIELHVYLIKSVQGDELLINRVASSIVLAKGCRLIGMSSGPFDSFI